MPAVLTHLSGVSAIIFFLNCYPHPSNILDSHCSRYEDCGLLKCDAVYSAAKSHNFGRTRCLS